MIFDLLPRHVGSLHLVFYSFRGLAFASYCLAALAVCPKSSLANDAGVTCVPNRIFERTALTAWIESQLRVGKIADLRTVECTEEECLASSRSPLLDADFVPDRRLRTISTSFLHYLLHDNNVPTVHIAGARFVDPICIRDTTISKSVALRESLFSENVDFRNTEIAYDMILDGSHFLMDLDISGAVVGATLSLRSVHVLGAFSLRHSHVNQDFLFQEAPNSGKNVTENERSLVQGEFTANSAKIEGEFNADFVRLVGDINMQFVSIGEDLHFRHGVEFGKPADLRSSAISGRFSFSAGQMSSLDLSNISIGDSLVLCEITADDVSLLHADIGNDLDLRGSIVNSRLQARGLAVSGDLLFDYKEGIDGGESCDTYGASRETQRSQRRTEIREMVLQDAQVEFLQDRIASRSGSEGRESGLFQSLEIDGLIHKGFHEVSAADGRSMAALYLSWLDQDTTFTPQPYQHLASVLRARGEYRDANKVLFHSRRREKNEACENGDWVTCAGLWLLEVTVGYGIGAWSFLVLPWVIALSLVGGVVIWRYGAAEKKKSLWWATLASFDYMLPIVKLDENHEEFISKQVQGWPKGVMCVLALAGWLLASFVIAAVAGLTQGA
jgi:hypothetical protein